MATRATPRSWPRRCWRTSRAHTLASGAAKGAKVRPGSRYSLDRFTRAVARAPATVHPARTVHPSLPREVMNCARTELMGRGASLG
jgi:hypothetical protein